MAPQAFESYAIESCALARNTSARNTLKRMLRSTFESGQGAVVRDQRLEAWGGIFKRVPVYYRPSGLAGIERVYS